MSRLSFAETSVRGAEPLTSRLGVAGIAALALVMLGLWPTPQASAQERVLRLHHIQPETSPQHLELLQPWAERIAKASNGRLRIEVSGGMSV